MQQPPSELTLSNNTGSSSISAPTEEDRKPSAAESMKGEDPENVMDHQASSKEESELQQKLEAVVSLDAAAPLPESYSHGGGGDHRGMSTDVRSSVSLAEVASKKEEGKTTTTTSAPVVGHAFDQMESVDLTKFVKVRRCDREKDLTISS
jgi:hypothetical protein